VRNAATVSEPSGRVKRCAYEYGFPQQRTYTCPPQERAAAEKEGFVEASPSRAFRGGEDAFLFKLSRHSPHA
jgi:hypothetical protein